MRYWSKLIILFRLLGCQSLSEKTLYVSSENKIRTPNQVRSSHLLYDDPAILQNLEKNGFTFGEVVFGYDWRGANNQKLVQNNQYLTLITSLETELDELMQKDPELCSSMACSHRIFDKRWLRSPHAKFDFIGVVNRMDRTAFNPNTCGELRLLYRLSYKKEQNGSLVTSRLPFTVNAIFLFPKTENCSATASEWMRLSQEQLKSYLSNLQFKTLELNLQSVRWPATVRPDMGGHAEYILRVFKKSGNAFVASSLENTPDTVKLNSNPALKAELLSWIKRPENIKALDQGTLLIPEKFLAQRGTSFALHGMVRLASRPFDLIFKESDFQTLSYNHLENIFGPSSLRRRLNDMSCAGCHQGRSIAGFHFVGRDPSSTVFANSVFSSRSPHLVQEIERRGVYFEKLVQGQTPDTSRPFSERDSNKPGKLGEHCGLRNSEFESWNCAQGLSCMPVIIPGHKSEIGECLPEQRPAGSPCQLGVINQKENSHLDKLTRTTDLTCRSGFYCESMKVGFPGGMCSNDCSQLQEGETCGAIAVLTPFNDCLAQGKPFDQCLTENTRPGAVQACDDLNPCRSDYICTKTANGVGGCIPPYFLFQLRVDGHPKPI